MPIFRIGWTGTVYGESTIRAKTLEEAIKKAKNNDDEMDDGINIIEYPDDWDVDEGMTIEINGGHNAKD